MKQYKRSDKILSNMYMFTSVKYMLRALLNKYPIICYYEILDNKVIRSKLKRRFSQ